MDGCENYEQEKHHKNEESNDMNANLLVGYVRKSNAGGALKVSINTSAFGDCATYVTSDGQAYVPLVISLNALGKVLDKLHHKESFRLLYS